MLDRTKKMTSNQSIVRNKSVIWRSICRVVYLSLFSALVLGCSSEPSDPFNEDSIKDDLENRSMKQVHDEYERSEWTPPVSGLMTETEISSFVQMIKLSKRIAEINGADSEQIVEEVSHIEYPRMPKPADVRASLRLGLNPREMKWTERQISAAARSWKERRALELRIGAVRRVWQESQLDTRSESARSLDRAKADLERWKRGIGDAEQANSDLVSSHRTELAPFFPALQDR
jgi:hypothetical protein